MTTGSAKPIIVYVDDEPNNLAVFEAALPDDWDIITFDSPTAALAKIDELNPWVVVSDQRMPGMKGIDFLEIVKKLVPKAFRIIVTGFSDEDLVVESVRKAQVSDYIRKPWDVDQLEQSMRKVINGYLEQREKERVYEALARKTLELEDQARDLKQAKTELEIAALRETDMRREIECWVPPFVLWAVKHRDITFPMKKDLVGVTFDIVGSSDIHDTTIGGKPVRSRILEVFSESILRNGGWRESHAGDSAYAHFGLLGTNIDPFEAAMSAAREFRVALRGISQQLDKPIECGIALHFAKEVLVDVHTIQLQTPNGIVTQKSFDTTSSDIDLLHRIEKLVHTLPGSNIIMTQEFARRLKNQPAGLRDLGFVAIRGQKQPVSLSMLKSDLVNENQMEHFLTILNVIKKAA